MPHVKNGARAKELRRERAEQRERESRYQMCGHWHTPEGFKRCPDRREDAQWMP